MDENEVKRIIKRFLKQSPLYGTISPEQQIIVGGCTADFGVESPKGDGVLLIECKGSGNPGTIAGGIGQAVQYNYQKKFNSTYKNANIWFVCPRDIISILNKFYIPKNIEIKLVERPNKVFDYRRTASTIESELQLPGTFYIEGIRIKFIREAIRVIFNLCKEKEGALNREEIKKELGKKCSRLSASAHRNTLITLSSLDIIYGAGKQRNRLTPKGYRLYGILNQSEEEFNNEMIDIFYPFLINVINAFLAIALNKGQKLDEIKCSNKEISKKINELYGEEVRYLNNPRRINTIIHILEELGVLISSEGRRAKKYKINKLIHPKYLP